MLPPSFSSPLPCWAGYQPLDAYGAGHLTPHLTAALSRILQQCHQLYGFTRMTSNAARGAADASSRERLSALPVFVEALACVPFLMPDHWADDSRICDDLPSYTIHLEQPMRQVSTKVLHRCMHALPALRDPILGGVAMFVARLPEEHVEVVRESLGLLLSLLHEWLDLAAADARAAALAGGAARSARPRAFSSLHRVEGAALALLCAGDGEVRRLALAALRGARQLHLALAAPPPPPPAAGPGSRRSTMAAQSRRASLQHAAQAEGSVRLGVEQQLPSSAPADPSQPPFVADAIEHTSGGILQRSYWDFGRCSDLIRVWRPLPEGVTFEGCMMQARTHEVRAGGQLFLLVRPLHPEGRERFTAGLLPDPALYSLSVVFAAPDRNAGPGALGTHRLRADEGGVAALREHRLDGAHRDCGKAAGEGERGCLR